MIVQECYDLPFVKRYLVIVLLILSAVSVNALTIGDKSGFYGSGTITRPTVSPFD